jgi:hypothetical protein
MGMAPGQQAQVMSSSPLPPQSNSVVPPQDAKALVLSGNGPAGSSGSSTDIFSALTQPKASASVPPTLLYAQLIKFYAHSYCLPEYDESNTNWPSAK